jgi:hypothetical protein
LPLPTAEERAGRPLLFFGWVHYKVGGATMTLIKDDLAKKSQRWRERCKNCGCISQRYRVKKFRYTFSMVLFTVSIIFAYRTLSLSSLRILYKVGTNMGEYV